MKKLALSLVLAILSIAAFAKSSAQDITQVTPEQLLRDETLLFTEIKHQFRRQSITFQRGTDDSCTVTVQDVASPTAKNKVSSYQVSPTRCIMQYASYQLLGVPNLVGVEIGRLTQDERLSCIPSTHVVRNVMKKNKTGNVVLLDSYTKSIDDKCLCSETIQYMKDQSRLASFFNGPLATLFDGNTTERNIYIQRRLPLNECLELATDPIDKTALEAVYKSVGL